MNALMLSEGKIYLVVMPEKPDVANGKWVSIYDRELEKAKSEKILCSDQEQAMKILERDGEDIVIDHPYEIPGLTYTTEPVDCGCRMGKDCQNCRTVALLSVTGETETQDQIWKDMFHHTQGRI